MLIAHTPPPVGWSREAIKKFNVPNSLYKNTTSFSSFCRSRHQITRESLDSHKTLSSLFHTSTLSLYVRWEIDPTNVFTTNEDSIVLLSLKFSGCILMANRRTTPFAPASATNNDKSQIPRTNNRVSLSNMSFSTQISLEMPYLPHSTLPTLFTSSSAFFFQTHITPAPEEPEDDDPHPTLPNRSGCVSMMFFNFTTSHTINCGEYPRFCSSSMRFFHFSASFSHSFSHPVSVGFTDGHASPNSSLHAAPEAEADPQSSLMFHNSVRDNCQSTQSHKPSALKASSRLRQCSQVQMSSSRGTSRHVPMKRTALKANASRLASPAVPNPILRRLSGINAFVSTFVEDASPAIAHKTLDAPKACMSFLQASNASMSVEILPLSFWSTVSQSAVV